MSRIEMTREQRADLEEIADSDTTAAWIASAMLDRTQ